MKKSNRRARGDRSETFSLRSLRSPRLLSRKRFGQHFLEPAWVDKVIRAIDPKPDETFLEIGPGRGALTRPLAARAKAVIAYEIDRDLAGALRATAASNLTVLEGDFLESARPAVAEDAGRVRVAGNLPYNAASPILFKLVDWYRAGLMVGDATLMLQREVADRLAAAAGTREYGVLTVLIGRHASIDRLLLLPPGAFRPAPKVQSAIVRLRFHAPDPAADDEELLEEVVKAAFTRRRKTMPNALAALSAGIPLSADTALARAGIDAARRPETLTFAEWVRLVNAYASARAVL
jgi:16S rRNA (adenine1518-N6/adenine1519-N6)-dimethyltransferase